MPLDLLKRGKSIKLAIFDVDGVLTDGRLYFLEDGSEFKTFNTLDGQGIKMLMAAGVQTAIISGRIPAAGSGHRVPGWAGRDRFAAARH